MKCRKQGGEEYKRHGTCARGCCMNMVGESCGRVAKSINGRVYAAGDVA